MTVVSDSTPLIHFAKVGYVDILFSLYDDIFITNEVYKEVVEEGLVLEKEDAVVIRGYIGKRIHVKNPRSSPMHLVEKYLIRRGQHRSFGACFKGRCPW